ncbi:hypothetical protein F8M41_017858 [Gigaspora margarita]|uniref:Uncharacterized protein n=1 Tax=Gigaspora margarita TaxID=4874 RepID=A0A8H4ELV2_GIGMA|nr:hypothetical protein F8M41_017858 [Gigaspora margarita]
MIEMLAALLARIEVQEFQQQNQMNIEDIWIYKILVEVHVSNICQRICLKIFEVLKKYPDHTTEEIYKQLA